MSARSHFEKCIKAASSCKKDVYIINKITHGCLEIWNFSSRVQLDISLVCCTHWWGIEMNSRWEIPYLRVPMHELFSIHYIIIVPVVISSSSSRRISCVSSISLVRCTTNLTMAQKQDHFFTMNKLWELKSSSSVFEHKRMRSKVQRARDSKLKLESQKYKAWPIINHSTVRITVTKRLH